MLAASAALRLRDALLLALLGWIAFTGVALAAPEGHAAHVPEPMHIDLVRGLGPEAGELEVNVLGTTPITGADHEVTWAPEIEWAPTRDFAIEMEVPMHDLTLDAVKLSAQVTLRRARGWRPAQGLQAVASLPVVKDPSLKLLHVMQAPIGHRFGVVTMIGPRLAMPTGRRRAELGVLAAASMFVSLPRGHAIGVESSYSGNVRAGELELLPQVHVKLGKHARVQLGVGAKRGVDARWGAFVGARVIVER
jgi:hypothetical protein